MKMHTILNPASYPQFVYVVVKGFLLPAKLDNPIHFISSTQINPRLTILCCLIALLYCTQLQAQPTLFQDINPGGDAGLNPSNITDVNGTVFFTANDGNGYELWKSDGTIGGTVMVKDIYPGSGSSFPSYLTNFNGTVFFTANDGNGYELWKSDGTAGGTVMVKDIVPGSGSSLPKYLANVNGTLFFGALSGATGYELWKSDGTAGGTVMVKDIRPGNSSSDPYSLTNVNGTLFFRANDGTNGIELWKSDGTIGGTVMVKDIYPGGNSSIGNNSYFTNVNGTLFFAANNGSNGTELWKSDGTAGGTMMVKDIYPGSTGSIDYYSNFTNVNGTLFFAADNGTHGRELWKSNGTAAGTVSVKDISPGSGGSIEYYSYLTNVNGTLFFAASNGTHGRELWKSDGSTAGTVMVKDIIPGSGYGSLGYLVNVNGTLFFTSFESTTGLELWKSDGTEAGTVIVKDIFPSNYSSLPNNLTNINGTLYFSSDDGCHGRELWKSDGTEVGTAIVSDFVNPNSGHSNPSNFVDINGVAYFTADDGCNGSELWKSDGNGPLVDQMIKDIKPGAVGSDPSYLTKIGSTLFFAADDGTNGRELWKSDGTAAGTVMLKDIYAGTNSSSPSYMVNFNGTLFFQANEGTNGYELWKSDGTAAGTVLVKDIQNGSSSSSPSNLYIYNGAIYFSAYTSNGVELWKSDGTAAGTVLVKDIYAGSYSSGPSNFCEANGILFFRADNGPSGAELWKTDGTEAGTVLVKDIYPGGYSHYDHYHTNHSFPSYIVNYNDILYFNASTNNNGRELWKSDGTEAGTVIVKDIVPGTGSSDPTYLAVFNDKIYFRAYDAANGYELWESDGTEAGTVLSANIGPGNFSSNPQYLTVTGGRLLFAADDQVAGREVFALQSCTPLSWYPDTDADGYGGTPTQACDQPTGFFAENDLPNGIGDCNDTNANIHPGAAELCNGIDDNCDGVLEGLPGIAWQNTIGGSVAEDLRSVWPTTDGGYILGGQSASGISGDKTESSQGGKDYWVVKLDASGNISWQNTLGGSSDEELFSVQQTADGGYIIGGHSLSNASGDKTENNIGIWDYWVVKLDASGNIAWQNTIGGSSHDFLISIRQTADGGYILGGQSQSNVSGDKTENSNGDFDYWIVKLNITGAISWQNTIGGSGTDVFYSIEQTSDGGYIVGGSSNSGASGDKTEGNLGSYDYWVLKLNSTGSIVWQNTIGGSGEDRLFSVSQTSDGGYILGGHSASNISSDKTENSQGGKDYWVVKLNSSGSIVWQNTIGGSLEDILYSVQQTYDGGYILGGYSNSNTSGDKTENSQGGDDYWLVRLDNAGNISWQETIGGNSHDNLYAVHQTLGGGYILAGSSISNISGDKTENIIGAYDYWVMELRGMDADGDGYITCENDCDDTNAAINPGINESCNGIDDDCDGIVDEEAPDTWAAQTSGTTASISKIWVADANNAWAVGPNGLILKWNGSTWTQQTSGTTSNLSGVWGLNTNSVWAVGENGTIRFWNGSTWSGQSSGTSNWFYNVWGINNTHVWAVGAGGVARRWDGSNWQTQSTASSQNLYDVWGSDVNNVWAVGHTGIVLKWNGTSNWNTFTAPSPAPTYLACLWGTNASNLWTVGSNGVIFKWNGSTWTSQTSGTTNFFSGLWGTNASNIWAVGGNGTIKKWNGTTWHTQNSGTTQPLNDVFLADAENVWAVGGNGTILKYSGIDTWYLDADGDGYGSSAATIEACTLPSGYAANSTDCNDASNSVHPGATETCNMVDEDCDGLVDEGFDQDGDGYTVCQNDCDDTNPAINPGATEVCNGVDDDCNGLTNEGFDQDGDGFAICQNDCDDSNPAIHPGATETCNLLDDDCANGVDDGFPTSAYYLDNDGDGFGTGTAVNTCQAPGANYMLQNGDCDDSNAAVHPNAPETCNGVDDDCANGVDDGLAFQDYYLDADGDGYGTGTAVNACQAPANHVLQNGDCNDNAPAVYPGSAEVCNTIDDDCDGQIDNGPPASTMSIFSDATWKSTPGFQEDWNLPAFDDSGWSNAVIFAGAANCGATNNVYGTDAQPIWNAETSSSTAYFRKTVNVVNVGLIGSAIIKTVADDDHELYVNGMLVHSDLGNNPAVFLETDIKNLLVEGDNIIAINTFNVLGDCRNLYLEFTINYPGVYVWFADMDGDGYGDPENTTQACTQPLAFVSDGLDCDDDDAGVHPGAVEVCNGLDEDCDGNPDDVFDMDGDGFSACENDCDDNDPNEFPGQTWYPDVDGDGYSGAVVAACERPTGLFLLSELAGAGDCNDANADIHPGAAEICNGLDEDCDGETDEDFDQDGDGYKICENDCNDADAAINPGVAEICNGIDDDCANGIDDGLTFLDYYEDNDGDGFGAGAPVNACQPPGANYYLQNDDCDDTDEHEFPGQTWYIDGDGDNYGGSSIIQCERPTNGFLLPEITGNGMDDCDDMNAAIHPNATEICNALDDDCDGVIDEPTTNVPAIWNDFGGGLSDFVAVIITTGGTDVYAGGDFQNAGSNSNANNIARWDGGSWNALGNGVNSSVRAMAVDGNDIYVGGSFTDAGGNGNADRIARWDGTNWNPLGTGCNNTVRAITKVGNDVYIGGGFTDGGGNANADYIGRWDGNIWNALGNGLNSTVDVIVQDGNSLLLGGLFTDAGGHANADYIARWNGSSWEAVGAGLTGRIYAIAVDGQDIYVGGDFTNAGGNADADYIAYWNGSAWQAVGMGLNGIVNSIQINGNDIYVGGHFMDAGGVGEADRIARWDGSSWNALGSGLNNVAATLAINGYDLFVGGLFTDASGISGADRIARWGAACGNITADLAPVNESCTGNNDGSITVGNTNGGYPCYQYSLDGGVWQFENIFSGLGDGDFQIKIKDAYGCVSDIIMTTIGSAPAPTWYADVDGDGFGDANQTTTSCEQPFGFEGNNVDCNDNNPSIFPNAPETCNGLDDDCDGIVDEEAPDTWAAQPSGTSASLSTFWAADTNNAWAVGGGGTILYWDGSDWSAQASGTTSDLSGVWGLNANNVWAVGQNGTIRYWNGSTWSGQSSGTSNWFYDVWGTDATHVWAVGQSGVIRMWNGSAWTTQSSPNSQNIYDVWGTASNNVWAVGHTGIIHKWNGSSWSSQTPLSATYLACVWGTDASNVWTVGSDGKIFKWNGSAWTAQASGTTQYFSGLWGTDANNIWAVGGDGTIKKYNGTSWFTQTSSTALALNDVQGVEGSNVWVIGADGLILNYSGVSTWYPDDDEDTFGGQDGLLACIQPMGYILDNTDCDDTNAGVYPGATETTNGMDDDCDGYIDENTLWINDPAVNNMLRKDCGTTAGHVRAISDGAGGMIAVWEEINLAGDIYDLYAQRIDSNGEVLWGSDGVPVCTAPEKQHQLQIVSDGANGVVIVWNDQRSISTGSGTGDDIFVQRINADGLAQWTNDGIAVCSATGNQTGPYLCSDGNGGTYIAWTNGSSKEIYAQRLDGNGQAQWQVNGIAITDNIANKELYAIAADGAGKAIIAFVNDIFPYALKFDGTGNVNWQTQLYDSNISTGGIRTVITDGSGGVIVPFNYISSLFAQRVNSSGARQWGTLSQPVLVCQTDGGGSYGGAAVSDGAGGIVLAWNDNRHSHPEIYSQRINNAGIIQWQTNGIRITNSVTNDGASINPWSMVPDGAGGAILAERHYNSTGNSLGLFAHRLNSMGVDLWGSDGKVVSAFDAGISAGFPFMANENNCEAIIGFKRPACLRASKISCAGDLIGQDGYVRISPKAFLQGPYNAGLMGDGLRSAALLPSTEPYTALGFAQVGGGGETVDPTIFNTTGNNAIVDWVFLQLRDKNNPSNVLHTRSALLQRDGDIVDVDGVSPVFFTNRTPDEYYLAVRHRNHLGVMTANFNGFLNIPCPVDFTSISTYGTNAQKDLGSGVMGLWAGNANSNSNVRYSGPANDQNKLLNTCLGGNKTGILENVYDACDLNMDGKVRYSGPGNDQNILLNQVLGGIKTAIINQNF